ncbi:MAG: Hpt domain-containing protein [Sulfurimonas sp.]|uniref:Hpt domain-containing protein n=1 Tax=Sulfurimonas sp. TaxID=2022749 RepID=UPI0025FD896C|nr:Hpt domain-containing protein [Sulfurimonas sp.]MCK9492418.1 Hpt domain-containing protein [Sulfurimonas sp.]
MLIYNHQKEFIGIDESNLKTLGFSTLSQLISEADDFADLFVKTPGYIHNFKHVHWIDFVICAESNQESRVIINVKGKSFRCNLDIKGIYLKEDPNNMGYSVKLVNLRVLNQAEQEMAQKEIEQKPATKLNTPLDIIEDDYEETANKNENLEIKYDVDDTISIDDFDAFEDPIKDIYEDEPLEVQQENKEVPKEIKKESLISLYGKDLEVGSDYIYNPKLASDELGLPIELIEEFVQDFIAQANDFKTDLYNSLSDQNIDNVKILSHKLKGVAANLRIEDAFEVLTTINSSEDLLEIEQSLNMFYKIVDTLAKKKDTKEQISTQEDSQSVADEDNEDDMFLSFKDEDEVKDSDIPDTIEMPELADDDFINLELDEDIFEPEEKIEIEEIEEFEETPEIKEEIETQKDIQIYYDRAKAASEIGIDAQNFNELLVDFTDEAKAYISAIRAAIINSDFGASKSSCIKLKRMCETMRIDSFDEELNLIMNTEDKDVIQQAISTIDTKLDLISSTEA